MGSNLRYEDIKNVIKQIGPGTETNAESELSQEEVTKEWKRLASFMNGKK